MLKKFLTTIIVLAATATAWADGYSYTLDKDGARATITTGEQTLEEVITAIKGLTPTVQYVILPDGMTKAEVNSIATENGFVVAVSKNEATTTETKWVYKYNDEEFIYEGTPTTTDGVSKATVKVLVPLKVIKSSYKLGDNPYDGTVFYDSNGKCYGVNNESDIFNLTPSGKGYTYNNGATEYKDEVAESEGKYYGVINNPTKVALELNKPVSWTYENDKYAHLGEVYNNGAYIFWQGGTEYPLTTETRYTYDNGSKLYPENGLTRTADNKTYGWVGGTQVSLTQKDALFNGTTLYTGPVREADGVTYGGNWWNGPFELIETTGYTDNNNTLYTGPVRTTVVDGKTQYFGNTGSGEVIVTSNSRKVYKDNYNNTQLYGEDKPTRTGADGKTTYGNTGTPFKVSYIENAYTYENGTKVYTGATRTDTEGKTYGNTGSGEVTLTSEQAYTYDDNGKIKVYTGLVRTTVVDGKPQYYGNTGEMLPLTTTTTVPWTYDSGKYIYEGEYVSGTNGNVGGTFYELTKVTATAEDPVYTYDNENKLHKGEVTESGDQYNKTYTATIGNQIITVYLKTSGDYYYYTKDGENHIYHVDWGKVIYTKLDGTGQYAYEDGTGTVMYDVKPAAENVKYYTDADKKKVVYTGNVYTDNDNNEYGVKDINSEEDLTYGTVYYNGDVLFTGNVYDKTTNEGTVKVGYTNSDEKLLEKKNVYVKDDNITVYSGNVYEYGVNYYGFENGYEVVVTEETVYLKEDGTLFTGNVYDKTTNEGTVKVGDTNPYEVPLTYGIVYLKKSDNTLYTGTVYHKQGDNTAYMGGGCNEFTATSAIAWFYKLDGGEETQYTAGIYNDGENTVGFIGGVEKELTQGEVKYYTKGEQTIIATDNTRISLDGDTYCDGSNAIGLTNKEGFTANLYKDGDRYVIYTGKVYGDATGYIGGTETLEDGSTDPSGIDAEASIKKGAIIVYQDTNNSSKDFHQRKVASLK